MESLSQDFLYWFSTLVHPMAVRGMFFSPCLPTDSLCMTVRNGKAEDWHSTIFQSDNSGLTLDSVWATPDCPVPLIERSKSFLAPCRWQSHMHKHDITTLRFELDGAGFAAAVAKPVSESMSSKPCVHPAIETYLWTEEAACMPDNVVPLLILFSILFQRWKMLLDLRL